MTLRPQPYNPKAKKTKCEYSDGYAFMIEPPPVKEDPTRYTLTGTTSRGYLDHVRRLFPYRARIEKGNAEHEEGMLDPAFRMFATALENLIPYAFALPEPPAACATWTPDDFMLMDFRVQDPKIPNSPLIADFKNRDTRRYVWLLTSAKIKTDEDGTPEITGMHCELIIPPAPVAGVAP